MNEDSLLKQLGNLLKTLIISPTITNSSAYYSRIFFNEINN
jgi:hypothetical protein